MSTRPAGESADIAPDVLAVMREAKASIATPSGGWLRAARRARGVSQKSLAQKLGVKRQAWAQLEASEAREAISLYSLRRAADALGYEVVYFLVPRGESAIQEPQTDRNALRAIVPESTMKVALPAETFGAAAPWIESELPTELR